jgi:hypothetical protein
MFRPKFLGSKPSLEICFLLLSITLILGTWSLFLRAYPVTRSSKLETKELKVDNGYLQHLIDEATSLLKEISSSNFGNISRDDISKHFLTIKNSEKYSELLIQCSNRENILSNKLRLCEQSISNDLPSSSIAAADTGYWLIIGIPTVSRIHNEDYLLQTLKGLTDQLLIDSQSLLYHKLLIVLINFEGSNHRRFYEAQAFYNSSLYQSYFQFLEMMPSEYLPDPKIGSSVTNDPGNANLPGYKVRRQTRSIVSVIRKILDVTSSTSNSNSYYLFLEDDMILCPYGFSAIQYLLQKASRYHPNWLAIRASYGMNGIFMRYRDLKIFSEYLLRHQLRRPPDHLVVEWYCFDTFNKSMFDF